jgi:serine O-acetyltransferase
MTAKKKAAKSARKKSRSAPPRRGAAKRRHAGPDKAKTRDAGETAARDRLCQGLGREVPAAVLRAAKGRTQRYRALPKIVQAVVDSCARLPRINHVDATMLPDSDAAVRIIEVAREIFFPGYYGDRNCTGDNLAYHIGDRLHELYLTLSEQIYRSVRHECRRPGPECPHCKALSEVNAQEVLRCIPEIRRLLDLDVEALYDGDPAAKSAGDIILSYPGLLAISVYRLAHELTRLGVPLLPRMLTEHAHTATGIDIHPGATIGESFFIDHGTGVVIGETTLIGDHVKLYQGVTLGALSFPKDACGQLVRGTKRHPTIEDHVTIYAQATILGGDTVVGRGSTVGGNVWLTESVPANSYVTIESPRLVVRRMRRRRGGRGKKS